MPRKQGGQRGDKVTTKSRGPETWTTGFLPTPLTQEHVDPFIRGLERMQLAL